MLITVVGNVPAVPTRVSLSCPLIYCSKKSRFRMFHAEFDFNFLPKLNDGKIVSSNLRVLFPLVQRVFHGPAILLFTCNIRCAIYIVGFQVICTILKIIFEKV